ncbi:MAG: hypothetical protein PHY57_11140 [Ignavibacterium sp.]|jgi:hypothetical protein|nr:MAG: hypothetical protein F9K42_02010 [Ignavibacterium sp.]MDD5609059.1 hypothetical protein [Ignavibacterium sp.]MDX9712564.1 hypothetical protein [Ignavibacteriaceae bacterium]
MTTLYTTKKACSVCNIISDQTGISSTNEFGSPDLDTRPPEMKRSTIDHWVEKCPHCGYCNSSIEDPTENAEEIVYSQEYRSILENKNYSELVRSFLCQSYIFEYLGKLRSSIWSQLHAAWVCDDQSNKDGAKQCRKKTFKLIETLWSDNDLLMEEKGGDYILAIDLLRRSELFEEASDLIKKGSFADLEGFILDLLKAEEVLVEQKNDLRYTMEDALKLVEKH